jgi:hypothetical protein
MMRSEDSFRTEPLGFLVVGVGVVIRCFLFTDVIKRAATWLTGEVSKS